MRVLAITKIFPNRLEPLSSPFNRQQFQALQSLVDLTVLDAIPYVPFARFTGVPKRARDLASLPHTDDVAGIFTHYMRQLYLPKVGLPFNLPLYLTSLLPYLPLARAHDVILGTWAYPDGCAAIVLGQLIGRPVVVKVHGSDINVLGKRASARTWMGAVLPQAAAIVSVSRGLSAEIARMGVSGDRIHLVPNGVDAALFFPRHRQEARASLGLELGAMKLLVFVGRLEPEKGLVELLHAFENLAARRSDVALALVGEGVMRGAVDELSRKYPGRLFAPGARPLDEVARWLGAADVFTLPSYNEGSPNVVLEALASGRPAVGTRVGGIPDAIVDGENGFLVPVRDAPALEETLLRAVDRAWNAEAIARTGPISWKESAEKLFGVLELATR